MLESTLVVAPVCAAHRGARALPGPGALRLPGLL